MSTLGLAPDPPNIHIKISSLSTRHTLGYHPAQTVPDLLLPFSAFCPAAFTPIPHAPLRHHSIASGADYRPGDPLRTTLHSLPRPGRCGRGETELSARSGRPEVIGREVTAVARAHRRATSCPRRRGASRDLGRVQSGVKNMTYSALETYVTYSSKARWVNRKVSLKPRADVQLWKELDCAEK